jgi:hypothetical protein
MARLHEYQGKAILADNGFKWQVSQAGGYQPEWSRDGKKLFFLDYKGGMYSASVDWREPPRISTPQKLFDLAGIATTDSSVVGN